MPSSVLPSLNEERKEELLAQYDAHKEGRAYTLKEIPYSLTSTAATIHTITPDYLELKLDEESSLQLKVLPKGWRGYMVSMVPVSYTHLDVYKRQVLDIAVNPCGCLP